jgi:hypothetical protein
VIDDALSERSSPGESYSEVMGRIPGYVWDELMRHAALDQTSDGIEGEMQ